MTQSPLHLIVPISILLVTNHSTIGQTHDFHTELPILKGKVVTGVYVEESPHQLLLYEKVVPLIFEFRLRPDLWSTLPIGVNKFKLLPRLNCRSDNRTSSIPSTSDWLFTCPVFYHVTEFLKQFKSNFTDIHPVFRSGLRQSVNNGVEYQKFGHHPSLQFEDCEQIIARAWKGMYGRDLGLAEYRLLLEKCNTLPTYVEDQITDYSGTDTSVGGNSLFDSMRDNFMSYFFLNASDPRPSEMINNLLAIQGLHLINTFAEINRLKEALLSCQNQLIPYSFLKGGRLEKALQDIKLKLISQKYTLPPGLTISKLLKLPVADCIFGPTTLLVEILLPVVRVDRNFNLLKFSYPTFLYRDQLCGLRSVPDTADQPQSFLFDRSSKTLLENKCFSGDNGRDLCRIPDPSQRPLINRCIFDILNASFEGIRVKQYCSLHCEGIGSEGDGYGRKIIPLIQRVSPTRFVIAVNRITSILVKCEGKPDEMITPQIYGGVEVTLPCNCHIAYHDEKFHARAPCGNSLFIQHVIPEHMANSSWNLEGKYLLAEPSSKVNFSLFSENDSVSILQLQGVGNENEEDDAKIDTINIPLAQGESKESPCDKISTSHIYLWAFILGQTLVVLCLILFLALKLNSLKKQAEYGRSAVSFSVSQMTNLDETK